LAHIYRAKHDIENMIKWYEQASYHLHVDSMYELGNLYREQGNNHGMVNQFEKAVRYGNYNALIRLCKYYIDTENYKKMNVCLTKIVTDRNQINKDTCNPENLDMRDNILDMYAIKIAECLVCLDEKYNVYYSCKCSILPNVCSDCLMTISLCPYCRKTL